MQGFRPGAGRMAGFIGYLRRGLAFSALLPGQLGLERLLAVGDVRFVAGRIDENVALTCLKAGIFSGEAKVAAMRAEKDIAGQRVE